LVAFGGGVVGDLAGFVAATYLRGIDLIQVPTTLLAQVDSAIGGKVGVDFGGKNLLGAFKRAEKVIVCPEVLSTLPAEEFRSGMAEVLKYGLIMDADLWYSLQSPFGVQDPRMQPVIQRCIDHKQEIVRIDPYELGEERAILNFGHTIGHALEAEHQYTKRHGEMIAVGMVVEAVLGDLLGMAAPVEEIRKTLQRWGLPVFDPLLQEPDRLFAHMRKDKKASEGQLAFSLLDGLGSCRLVRNVDRKIVEEALRIVCAA
jgi:3-dehydroquinate synthase